MRNNGRMCMIDPGVLRILGSTKGMITNPQKVPGAKTVSSPAATTTGGDYVLAWRQADSSICWTKFPATNTTDTTSYAWGENQQIAGYASSGSPVLANLNGTVWMAWKGEGADTRIFVASLNGSNWIAGGAISGIGTKVSPALTATAATLVLAWKGEGDDRIYWSQSSNGSAWSPGTVVPAVGTQGPSVQPPPDALSSDSPTLASFKGVVYLGWKGASDNKIWWNSLNLAEQADSPLTLFTNDGWGASSVISDSFQTGDPPTLAVGDTGVVHLAWRGVSENTVFMGRFGDIGSSAVEGWSARMQLPDDIGTGSQPALATQLSSETNMLLAWKDANSTDLWVIPTGAFDAVPAPPGGTGLQSNSNYIIANGDCTIPLEGLVVTIDVTQDMVLQSVGAPVSGSQLQGFSFQLNAYSPKSDYCVIQQFVVALWGNQLFGAIQNYHAASANSPPLVNQLVSLTTVPQQNVLPKGYKLTISLEYGQGQSGIVTGALFGVTDNHRKVLAPVPVVSVSADPSQDLAPIVAFELDIVGPANGEKATLSSGAGTITYAASRPLTVASVEPTKCVTTSLVTQETANTVYGQLPAYVATPIVQSFHTTAPAAPISHKAGIPRPSVIRLGSISDMLTKV
jgi:hypothetical protein